MAIMASSVSSEHAFSSAGVTISKHCNRLKGNIVEAIQFIKCTASHNILYCEEVLPLTEEDLLQADDGDSKWEDISEAAAPADAILYPTPLQPPSPPVPTPLYASAPAPQQALPVMMPLAASPMPPTLLPGMAAPAAASPPWPITAAAATAAALASGLPSPPVTAAGLPPADKKHKKSSGSDVKKAKKVQNSAKEQKESSKEEQEEQVGGGTAKEQGGGKVGDNKGTGTATNGK
ncbi:hypothetical protein H0H87_005326 [Tephrocybe sp. NHM501043]|nr:hypothetical protein H0H87_005326 [Tephrocybe sp. NHM501043]